MLRLTIGVNRILSAANELSLLASDQLGLVEPQIEGPRPRVDWASLHSTTSFCCGSRLVLRALQDKEEANIYQILLNYK